MRFRQRSILSLLLALIGVLMLSSIALAESVLTDDNGISGFERYDNGLYWWSAGGRCSGEFPHDATVRLRYSLAGSTKTFADDCTVMPGGFDNAVRNEAYLYFFRSKQLSQVALNGLIVVGQDPIQPLSMAPALPANQEGTSLLLADGQLYWGVYHSGNNTSTIVRMPADNSAPPSNVTIASGQLIKLAWRRYTDPNGQSVDALVWINDANTLFRYKLGDPGVPQQLASGISDFALHTQASLLNATTFIYAAQGTRTPNPGINAGKLLRINLHTGDQTSVFNATGDDQIVAVGVDSNWFIGSIPTKNIYMALATVGCGELFCSVSNIAIYRHTLPATTTGWELMVASDVDGNLRSDDQWLYYTGGDAKRIDKIRTDAPALELDIKADGVEIVQVIQSLNMDVKLLANKPTYARGYAHFAKNTTRKNNWQPAAILRGFLNGVELPDSPLEPLNSISLGADGDINALRNDLARSYLFRLPASWVKAAGALTVQFEVDPQQTLPITASRADDKVGLKQAATIVKKADSCLDFVRMHTKTTIASNPPGLAEIVARSQTLLPVQDFQVRPSNIRISKPVFHVEIECWGPFCVPVPYITDEPFVMFEDKDWAMVLLTTWDTFNSDFGDCADSHLVGMVHPSEQGFNGLGLTSFSNDLMVRMEPGPYTSGGTFDTAPDFNIPYGGRTLAHELGHNYGREHVDQTASDMSCGGSTPDDPDTNYPYDTCTIGASNTYNGFDTQTQTLLLPASVGDLMSYAGSRWTSKYTWDAILDEVDVTNAVAQAASIQTPNAVMLFVTGLITPTANSARFEAVYLFPEGAAPQSEVVKLMAAVQPAAASADPYQLRQVDASGALLAEETLTVEAAHDDAGDALPFAHYVVFNTQTKAIQLVQGNNVLAERKASALAPTLTLQPPLVDEAKQTLKLQWMAFDNDNTLESGFTNVLYFTLQYSPDNGAHWHTLLVQYPWLAATIDARLLPGGNQALVRVLASDGFHTTLATSAPFVLAKHAPTPVIGGVIEGQRFAYTATIHLMGLGLDAEDGGISADNLSWSVGGATTLTGVGSTLDLEHLAPGPYTATLTATDSDNQVASAERHFAVLPVTAPDRSTPLLDGFCADNGYASAPSIRIPLDNGQSARAWLLHAAGKLFACLSDLPVAPSGAHFMTVQLLIDADASGGGQVQSGDRGFEVNEEGVPDQLVASGGVFTRTASPPLGYAVVVERGANGWSAEMAIAEALVGGWNHAARILLHVGAESVTVADLSAQPGVWPEDGRAAQPATWASAYFGVLPAQPNQAPVAKAGEELTVNLAVTQTLGLDGSASFDADQDNLTYVWSQVAGPTVTLVAGDSATPTFQVAPLKAPTILRFQLVVNDGSLNSAADEVEVTLLPTPRPHTPATFTPSDFQQEQVVFLPLVAR